MSAMAVAASGGVRSTLNPNAPLFIPASFQQVEDFSPEWWNLVKTSVWFRDHWISEHQGQETFDGDDNDDDVGDSLLPVPQVLDLSISSEEFSSLEEELEEVILQMEAAAAEQAASSASSPRKDKSWTEMDAADMIKSLSFKSPGNGGVLRRRFFDTAKHREKPAQCLSPKCSPRRIIQQPR